MFVSESIVVDPVDRELIDRHRHGPAPLLPILHAFHDRDGHLSPGAVEAIGKELRIPLADLYGTVTFYHHFSQDPGGLDRPRVCTGPICSLRHGSQTLSALLSQGAEPMACSGRCDEPVPVLQGHSTFVSDGSGALSPRPSSPLPVPNPGGSEEAVFRHIRHPNRASLTGYRESGGYRALEMALDAGDPEWILSRIEESGLSGKGGAGFPTGLKWRAVADAPAAPKTIVCNADEGEPGCFKDRAILDHDPFAVIEAMTLAALATGAQRGFLYLRYEYPEAAVRLAAGLSEARRAALLGEKILGTDFGFEIHLIRGAGAYICGEETSLLNSLEGRHPFPRNRPPYPVTHGFENLPTVVNNVETLAAAVQIVRKGPAWYQSLGLGEVRGTKVISLSGDVKRPGNYEVPLGLPLATLLHEWAGGPPSGRTIQAVTMAGLSGGFLAGADLDVTLDDPSIRSRGSFLGAGGIMVFDDSRDMVRVAHEGIDFFAHESCGKCFPCRIGTQRLSERLAGSAGPEDVESWSTEVIEIGTVMKRLSACGLGVAAPLLSDSLLKYFPEQVERHVENGR